MITVLCPVCSHETLLRPGQRGKCQECGEPMAASVPPAKQASPVPDPKRSRRLLVAGYAALALGLAGLIVDWALTPTPVVFKPEPPPKYPIVYASDEMIKESAKIVDDLRRIQAQNKILQEKGRLSQLAYEKSVREEPARIQAIKDDFNKKMRILFQSLER